MKVETGCSDWWRQSKTVILVFVPVSTYVVSSEQWADASCVIRDVDLHMVAIAREVQNRARRALETIIAAR